jgi:uncharacterized protein (TIGR03437 family)
LQVIHLFRALALAVLIGIASLDGQVNVLTYHNDLARTGQNLNETVLAPSNLKTGKFGELFSQHVDGQIYGQPLYLWGLSIPGNGVHNVVFVATEHDSVYAFDADSNAAPNAAPLWHVSFLNPALGVTPVPADVLQCQAITPEVGITGTPVIDPASGTLYVAAMTLEDFGHAYVQRLHALDVTTGAERSGSPVVIQASVPGTGDGSSTVTFNPGLYKERAGLLLAGGLVYTTWSSHCDAGGYHGWVIGYDAKTLSQVSVYTSTPNWDAGAVWQGGAAPAADAAGNIFLVTGNGTFDANDGGSDLSDSVLKLSTSAGLSVADYFTPFNAAMLSEKDLDLGSSGALLLPDSAGSAAHPHLLVTGSKQGAIYLLDRDAMGHFQAGSDSQIVQSLPQAVGALFGIPAYFNNTVYFAGQNDTLKAFPIALGRMSEQPASQSSAAFRSLGSVPSISANGVQNGIVWTMDASGLHAYDAANLALELYLGSIGSFVKFSTPTIANAKVYVGAADSLVVFGLQAAPAIRSIVNSGGYSPGAVAPGSIVSIFGTNLADGTATASNHPLPGILAGARILINGVAAPLLSASSNQINAQIPYETPAGMARVTATLWNSASSSIGLEIQLTAPGIFGVLLNQDGTINGPDHATTAGNTVAVFLTGLGQTQPPTPSGVPAATGSPASAMPPVSATIGGKIAPVLSTILAPGLVGVFELTLEVPNQPPGNYPLVVEAGGISSNSVPVSVGG